MPKMRKRRLEINAVHADDARAFLERIGAAGAFDQGSLLCTICGTRLDIAGIGAVRARDGEVAFACARMDCVRELA